MKFHSRLSIRQKIISIILAVTLLSIITGFTLEIFSTIRAAEKELTDNAILNAKVTADNLIFPILFDDNAGANNTLSKLENTPAIVYGAVFTPNDTIYAGYKSSPTLKSFDTSSEMMAFAEASKMILITAPIRSENEIIGNLILVASLDSIRQKTKDHINSILIILAISIIMAILLAFWLERIISGPILRLASVTRKIQETLDYSVRVEKEALDETGILYDGFNDMLQSIESRRKERDLAEKRLQEERENLEIRVIERTKELNDAKEKAEESDKLKSAFLANMSHEIRTPLNAILGFSALIRDPSSTPEEMDEYYKMMESSGNDLIKLIDDILDISRIEANQIKIQFVKTQVAGLSEEVFTIFKQSLYLENPANPVIPVFVIPEKKDQYVLDTDPLRLKQILLNLLNNAIKFTSSGTIEFGYFPDETKSHIIFYVKDTGIGIAKDQQKKIFDRFTKVADIKTKHYRGTGLGLSIALKLTQLLNGEIRVESELNVGSVFYLTFPLSDVVPVFIPEVLILKDESLAFLSGKTILIAEDVEYNFKYLEIILSKNKDVTILWASNGIEAVELFKQNPAIDVILMDIQLPEMNGLEATRLIRKQNPKLPIIAQTAYATPSDFESCINAGCNDVLPKPINKTVLLQTIKKHLPDHKL